MNRKLYWLAQGLIFFAGCMVLWNVSNAVEWQGDADLEQMEYCTYVQIWKDSQGQAGYPDYKRTFNEYCN